MRTNTDVCLRKSCLSYLCVIAILALCGEAKAGIVQLAWEPSQDFVQGYNVYRTDEHQAETLLTASPLTGTAFEDRTAENGRLHYYRVTAVGLDGQESDFSNQVAAVPGGQEDLRMQVRSPSKVRAGTRADFSITVSNYGNGPSGSVMRVTFNQPDGMAWDGWTGADWSCGESTLGIVCRSEVILLTSESSSFSMRFRFHPRVRPHTAIQADLRTAGGIVQSVAPQAPHIEYGLYAPYFLSPDNAFAGVSLTNHSDQPAQVDLQVFDPAGSELGPDLATVTLGPWSQLVELSYDHEAAKVQPGVGWLSVSTDSPDVGGFFQFGDRRLSQLDGARLFAEPRREIVFTRVSFGSTRFLGHTADTVLDLVNPGSQQVTLEAELALTSPTQELGRAVTLRRTERLVLGPHQLRQVRPEELFGEFSEGSGYIRVRAMNGDGILGFQRIQFDGGSSAAGLAAGSPQGQTLYSSHLAQSPDIFTQLKLINTAQRTLSVQLFAIGEDGQLVAPPVFLRMGPGQAVDEVVGDIFDFYHPDHVSGSLEVRADAPGLLGNVMFGDPNSFRFAAAVPLESESHLRLAFDYFASTSEFFTGLAICNATAETATVTLEALDRDGTVLAVSQFELGPRHLASQTLAELMPDVKGQIGGFLRLESTRPLIAQQLFGHRDLHFLSAVPAEELR